MTLNKTSHASCTIDGNSCGLPKLKILHAPTTVGGNPHSISRAEKKLGYDSHSLTLEQNYFAYEADEVVFDNKKLLIVNEAKRWMSVFKSLKNYNILHYNFGQTIAPTIHYPQTNQYRKWKVFLYSDVYCRLTEFVDLRIAKLLRKVVAVTYQGDDARQADYCKKNYPIHFVHEVSKNYYSEKAERLKRKRIKTFDKYADLIYAVNPDLMNVLPKRTKFMPYASVDPKLWTPVWSDENPPIPHIVHAPSHREIKGTKYILDAFERLKKEGVPFKFSLVENMPNAEARKVYETADILIDQLLAGYYGALAIELMALGKPVICYMREEDMTHLPAGMWEDCPIIQATPDSIYRVVKNAITAGKKDLLERGQKSRAYAEKWHDPEKIAASLVNDYERILTRKRGR